MSDRLKAVTEQLQAQQAANDQGYKVFAPAAANAMLAKSQDPLFGSAHYLGLLGRTEQARQDSQDDTAQVQAFMKEIMEMDIDAEIKAELIKQIAPTANAGVLNSVVPLKEYGIIDPIGAMTNDGTRINEREATTRKTNADAIGTLDEAGFEVTPERVAESQRGYTEPTTPTDSYSLFDPVTKMSADQTNDQTTANAAKLSAEAKMKDVNQQLQIAKIRAASSGNRGGSGGEQYSITEETDPLTGRVVRKVTTKGRGPVPPAPQQEYVSPFGYRQ